MDSKRKNSIKAERSSLKFSIVVASKRLDADRLARLVARLLSAEGPCTASGKSRKESEGTMPSTLNYKRKIS